MSEPPPLSPEPPKVYTRFHALVGAIPAVALAVGLWLMVFKAVPEANKDIVLAIVSGLLGYLARAAQAKGPGQ